MTKHAALPQIYETIGEGYAKARLPDPRIAQAIVSVLGEAWSIVNVGAGTGNYEPTDRAVVAVEPACAMLAQRSVMRIPAVRAVAEALPFDDHTFDAALAMFTLHHWHDLAAGLREMRRVARRQVVVLNEPEIGHRFWIAEYFAEAAVMHSEKYAPRVADLRHHLDVQDVLVLPIPADCTDGFIGAYWCRPEAYLDGRVRASMSVFAQMPPDILTRGIRRLQRELADGTWDRRFGFLRELASYDVGYRIVVAEKPPLAAGGKG
jgi:SAM-dependent methyltransferase